MSLSPALRDAYRSMLAELVEELGECGRNGEETEHERAVIRVIVDLNLRLAGIPQP